MKAFIGLAFLLVFVAAGKHRKRNLSAPQCSCGLSRTKSGLPMKAIVCAVLLFAFIAVEADNDTSTCTCGLTKTRSSTGTQDRIVGGVTANVNEFPLIGALTYVNRPNFIFCASTLVTKRHAISAAHCNPGPTRPVAILFGEHNTQSERESSSFRVRVDQFINHEQFDLEGNTEHDVAVLFLVRDVVFSPIVGPACFPDLGISRSLVGKKVRLAGWGTLYYKGPQPNALQKVDVDVVPMSACDKEYEGTTKGQICTYTLKKDACQGDSGGPVLYMDPSTRRYVVVGIVSFATDCALPDTPAVNTNVAAYSDWILSKINATDPTSTVCPNQ